MVKTWLTMVKTWLTMVIWPWLTMIWPCLEHGRSCTVYCRPWSMVDHVYMVRQGHDYGPWLSMLTWLTMLEHGCPCLEMNHGSPWLTMNIHVIRGDNIILCMVDHVSTMVKSLLTMVTWPWSTMVDPVLTRAGHDPKGHYPVKKEVTTLAQFERSVWKTEGSRIPSMKVLADMFFDQWKFLEQFR